MWRKRIAVVFIPYFIVQCVCYWPFHVFDIKDFILDVSFISPQYHNGWYLNYLLMWYTIFYFVKRITWTEKHTLIVLTVISCGLFFLLREIKAEQSFSFLAGIVLSECKNSKKLKKALNWKIGVSLLGYGFLFLALKQTDIVRNAPQLVYNFIQLMIKLPCGLGMCLILISVRKMINCKLFWSIGAISYELYLVHGYILPLVPVSVGGELTFIGVSVGTALALHYLLKLIKKPCKRILRI